MPLLYVQVFLQGLFSRVFPWRSCSIMFNLYFFGFFWNLLSMFFKSFTYSRMTCSSWSSDEIAVLYSLNSQNGTTSDWQEFNNGSKYLRSQEISIFRVDFGCVNSLKIWSVTRATVNVLAAKFWSFRIFQNGSKGSPGAQG